MVELLATWLAVTAVQTPDQVPALIPSTASHTIDYGTLDVAAISMPETWIPYKLADFLNCHEPSGHGNLDADQCNARSQRICAGEKILPGGKSIPANSLFCAWFPAPMPPPASSKEADRSAISSLARLVDERIGSSAGDGKRASIHRPQPGATVVHLRTGDVVDCANHTVAEMLSHQTSFLGTANAIHEDWNKYVRPIAYFQSHLTAVPKAPVILVTATGHTDEPSVAAGYGVIANQCNPQKSVDYVRGLMRGLRERGRSVTLRAGYPPDDDMSFITDATTFLASGGRYSSILASLVEAKGGKVLESHKAKERRLVQMTLWANVTRRLAAYRQLREDWEHEGKDGAKWKAYCSIHPIDLLEGPNVLVVSFGGVGTTSLIRELSTIGSLKVNDPADCDMLKHVPYERLMSDHPAKMANVKRIVYLVPEDPVHAVESLYRRGYADLQACKTRHDGGAGINFRVPRTLAEYATADSDAFRFAEHLESFTRAKKHPVAFLTMDEHVTDHLDGLAAFLDVGRDELRGVLKPWSEKSVKSEALDEKMRAAIGGKHKHTRRLIEQIRGLGGFRVHGRHLV